MNRETVNEAMEVEVPNGFYVLSAEELRLAYQSEDPNRWGMRDKERHIILTVMWKEYRGRPVLFLPGLKSVCKKNEQLNCKEYSGHGYRCDGFFSLSVDRQPAEGYRFSYRVGDVEQSAETILVRYGRTIYSITFAGRAENKAADKEVFAGIIAGIRCLP